jgi:membrane-bound lytic murein transglycosylase D
MSESKEMNLRAFLYKLIRQFYITTVVLIVGFQSPSFCQNQKLGDKKIPYEIKFADVTFQLNEVSRFLMSQEVIALRKNIEAKQDNLSKLGLVLPLVEPILRKENLPLDFRFLSIYNKYQKSIATTTLLDPNVYWCMDLEKAREVKLVINKEFDQRKHIVLATNGATICLKKNKSYFGNWGAVLFAHLANKDVTNLLEIDKKWTGEFISIDSPAYSSLIQFLAFKWVLEADYKSFKSNDPRVLFEYTYGKGKTLNLIAADLKIEPIELQQSNLWLKTQTVPESDVNIMVVVPATKYYEIRALAEASRNVANKSTDLGFPVLKENPTMSFGYGGVFYTINDLRGIQADMCDSYVTLAFKANINYDKFLEFNDMTDKDLLNVGQIYYVEPKLNKATIPHHIVKNEESLWDISQMYGVKLPVLLKFNRMDNVGRLQRGRLVYIQEKRPKNKPIEYVEFPLENQIDTKEDSKFEEDLVTQYVSSDLESADTEKEDTKIVTEKFDSNVLKRNGENEDKVVIRKEVKTKPVEVDIPVSEDIKEEVAERRPRNKDYLVHEVKKGETLYRLSVNYKVSIEQLYKLNNLKDNSLEVGDRIIVRKY